MKDIGSKQPRRARAKQEQVSGRVEGGTPVVEAARALGVAPLTLRGAYQAMGIAPIPARSASGRMAMLLSDADMARLKKALKS